MKILPALIFGMTVLALQTIHGQTYNTATGIGALQFNSSGTYDTADGYNALNQNSAGSYDTAIGVQSLYFNSGGTYDVGVGVQALEYNQGGGYNTAVGYQAMNSNTGGNNNTALGSAALYLNDSGYANLALGGGALYDNVQGGENTAAGYQSLFAVTGSYNIGLGWLAGSKVGGGNSNIEIGNAGTSSDVDTIRLGTQGSQTATFIAGIYGKTAASGVAVYIASNGKLGTLTSSAKFKQNIHDMGDVSDALLALRPVTFQYKPEIDPAGTPQFGLIAEEVEKVDPALVVHDEDHQIYSVRYEAVNAMLLNEFQKQHETIAEQEKTIADQQKKLAEQQKFADDQVKINSQQQQMLHDLAARLEQVEQAEAKSK